jgi:hypothetical protein
MKHPVDDVAVMLGHRSTAMLAFYVDSATSRCEMESVLKRAMAANGRVGAQEVTSGTCPAAEVATYRDVPCLTSPMARREPSVWDVSEYIEAERRGKSAGCGLQRSWSELDRTGSLAAHLNALDRSLDD